MIKQIQATHPLQVPVAHTPRIGRQASNASFHQQLYGALAPYLVPAASPAARVVPGSVPRYSNRSTTGMSQNDGAPIATRQSDATPSSGSGPIPAGVKPRVANDPAPTPTANENSNAAVPKTAVVTIPGVEYAPDGTALPPSLGFIHIIQPKTVTPPTAVAVPKNEYERYWASQPKAVQELKDIEDPTARRLKAWDLANQGYTIDVPIMVWQWDPQYTMELRKSYGYTWVPSALQNTVAIAPGLQMPGVTPYDPNSPPPGSILVNTDFV